MFQTIFISLLKHLKLIISISQINLVNMNPNLITFETEAEAAELLTYLENGIYHLQIEDFTLDKGTNFKSACVARDKASKRMRRHDIQFDFQGKGNGLFEINTQNNQLIDLNAQSKRSKLIEVFNALGDGETAKFSALEIDPVYCRSVLSKIGTPYTTKFENGFVHVTKTEKRLSVSAYLKELINNLENKGVIYFDGDINYLRQIASGLRTAQYRYSIKKLDFGKYEITRLFYEDMKAKSDYYDVIKKDYVDFYLEDNEISFLNSIVEKLKAKISGSNSEVMEFISTNDVAELVPTPEPAKKRFFNTDEIKPDLQPQQTEYNEQDDDEDYNPDEVLEGYKIPDLGPDIEDGII